MGIIIKYQLAFPDAKLKVSNDIFGGDFIIDADITVEMRRGQAGCSFEIDIYDLPLKKAKEIKPLSQVTIKLGYFDGAFAQVTEGVIEKITSKVKDDKLVTSIKGHESGTYALQNNTINIPEEKEISLKDNSIEKKEISLKDNSIKEAVTKILEAAKIEKGEIIRKPNIQNIPEEVKLIGAKTFNKTKLIKALDELAQIADAEFLVCDKQVSMGKPIKDESYKPPKFEANVNLAKYEAIAKEVPKKTSEEEKAQSSLLQAAGAVAGGFVGAIAGAAGAVAQAEGFDFVITGDPKLRPGQKVVAKVNESVAEISGVSNVEFLVLELTHKFTMSGGYTCDGRAITACNGKNCRQREIALLKPNQDRFVEESRKKNEEARRNNSSIEIGAVKNYTSEKHLTTVYFGQDFQEAETQPSINVQVNDKQFFEDKPIASPFAWHKCGLITPIYPGMKALLNHNRSLQDDVVIAGFIWSKEPEIKPPLNKEGDWWLCLPINPSSPPKDDTKAINDLIANDGKRVIEVKSLKITVGESKLKNIGERPTEGDDDEFLIEHSSGSKILIKKGEMQLSDSQENGAKILIKDGEIQLTDGKVTLKISGGVVDIS